MLCRFPVIISIFVIFMAIIESSIACKAAYVHEPFYDVTFPMYPLDICLEDNSTETSVYAHLRTCNSNTGELEERIYSDSNCDGNYSIIEDDYRISEVECDGTECDYAMTRFYKTTKDSNLCEKLNGEFSSIAVVVNFCIEVGASHAKTESGSYIPLYLSVECNENMLTNYFHVNSDCSDVTPMFIPGYINGHCYNMSGNTYQFQMINCTSSSDNPLTVPIIEFCIYIFIIIYWAMFSLVYLLVLVKLFTNLYKFRVVYIRNIPVCFKMSFLDKHNWLITPSKVNKIYAILSPILLMLYGIMLINDIINTLMNGVWWVSDYYEVIWRILPFLAVFGEIFNVLFLTSTLEYYMNEDSSIKERIPIKFINFLKFITFINGIMFICRDEFEVPYYVLVTISGYIYIVIIILVHLSLLYLYYRGMNNLCHYWYSKQWKEYDKHGENERIHEILIHISRVSVVVIAYVGSTLINSLSRVFGSFIGMEGLSSINNKTEKIWIVYSIFRIIISILLFIPSILTIYFIYPFGHVKYEKIYGKCHAKMYNYFKKKHQNEVKNGGFDGSRYQSRTKNKCLCFCLNFKKTNQNNMKIYLNDDDMEDDDL